MSEPTEGDMLMVTRPGFISQGYFHDKRGRMAVSEKPDNGNILLVTKNRDGGWVDFVNLTKGNAGYIQGWKKATENLS